MKLQQFVTMVLVELAPIVIEGTITFDVTVHDAMGGIHMDGNQHLTFSVDVASKPKASDV